MTVTTKKETKSYQDLVYRAIRYANIMHFRQKDKNGKDFVLHPLRVAHYLGPNADDELIAAAILHDVVEDTAATLEDIAIQFPERVVNGVDAMTRREGEVYRDYIHRVAKTKDGCLLKRADLMDNMDPRRATTPELRGMIESRYKWSLHYIDDALADFERTDL